MELALSCIYKSCSSHLLAGHIRAAFQSRLSVADPVRSRQLQLAKFTFVFYQRQLDQAYYA